MWSNGAQTTLASGWVIVSWMDLGGCLHLYLSLSDCDPIAQDTSKCEQGLRKPIGKSHWQALSANYTNTRPYKPYITKKKTVIFQYHYKKKRKCTFWQFSYIHIFHTFYNLVFTQLNVWEHLTIISWQCLTMLKLACMLTLAESFFRFWGLTPHRSPNLDNFDKSCHMLL